MNTTEKIILSIVNMQKLKIEYQDKDIVKTYTVHPHLVGKMKNTGNLVFSAYDVSGDDEAKGSWKTFLLNSIKSVDILPETFDQTATGYNPKDKRMQTIICNIPSVV